jgi:hypothetical protein
MSKVQGKQIDDHTITQRNLNLSLPNSGDTNSGATVGYVNEFISILSGNTGVIGAAEDGTYTDGIFTDFVPTTPIGTAIDRFNEVLLKLAPTPPSDFNTATLNLLTSTFSARSLTTGASVSGIVSTTTPTFYVNVPSNGLNDPTTGTLTFTLDSLQESATLTGALSKNTGVIRFTAGDPYYGIAGKAGFWSGFTALSAVSNAVLPASTLKTASYTHSIKGTITKTLYVDTLLTTSISGLTATVPAMTRYISGIPSLASGSTITNIGFSIINVSSYFYASSYVYAIGGTLVAASTGDPNTIPSANGETGTVTSKSTTVNNGVFSDTSFSFTVTPRNAASVNGTVATYTDNTKRVDTVSNESTRLTSGTGSYPSTGYGSTYDSTVSLVGTYTNELMLKNGIYQYPSGNYTAFGGPNYTSASGTRWATFNLGTFNNNSNFTLNFIGGTGVGTVGQANLYIQIKINGSTAWVDGNSAYAGVGNPGSGANGVAACTSSTTTSRTITFGSIVYSGSIIVRIGFTGSSMTFGSLTATNLI